MTYETKNITFHKKVMRNERGESVMMTNRSEGGVLKGFTMAV